MSNTPCETEEQEIEEDQDTSSFTFGKFLKAIYLTLKGWRAPKENDDEHA